MGDWWLALAAVWPLAVAVARMKAAGARGLVRTKLIWETEDGQAGEVPFFTFRF